MVGEAKQVLGDLQGVADLETRNKMTLIVFSGDMDRVLAAFNLAITAAAMGTEVTMFFTFWGLNVLKRKRASGSGKGIMRRMLNLMNSGTAEHLPLSKLNMFGLGPWMMKRLMKQTHLPSVEEMMKLARESGVKMIACSTSIGLMGLTKNDLTADVDGVAGAATYLGVASESNVNLFV
ncbi:MAG: DsrE/DsrF/DrsH-like family protein [Chloroflexi bacterium]|nr:DsrE/DsrF/DrsH-like family protein [Chloroflexota bacterium]